MRPVRKGPSPRQADFFDYRDAKSYLVSRLGVYCSYCERRVPTGLAVEHIQPKSLPAYKHLIGRWDNFLLSCVNCNSTKYNNDYPLNEILLPDRDNTFRAFVYSADGLVAPSPALSENLQQIAWNILKATGLDKPISVYTDENGKQVAMDRVGQRLEVWAIARDTQNDISANPENDAVRRWVVKSALGHGFFSIWMAVFKDDPDMLQRMIDAFNGTRASGCFDPATGAPVSPAPNPDDLPDGGKI